MWIVSVGDAGPYRRRQLSMRMRWRKLGDPHHERRSATIYMYIGEHLLTLSTPNGEPSPILRQNMSPFSSMLECWSSGPAQPCWYIS